MGIEIKSRDVIGNNLFLIKCNMFRFITSKANTHTPSNERNTAAKSAYIVPHDIMYRKFDRQMCTAIAINRRVYIVKLETIKAH